MNSMPQLTDRKALKRNRDRARAQTRAMGASAMFLHRAALDEIQERLLLVNRSFTKPAVVTGFPEEWQNVAANAVVVADAETLTLDLNTHDLVVHGMALHWANDPVGQLVQARRALVPDGLFLGIFLGGRTLHELRACLGEAEVAVTGGLSPRIAPMGEIRDLGGLLQRAGFAMPVADVISLTVSYKSVLHLMHDLRAMGEANAMTERSRQPLRRAVLQAATDRYLKNYGDGSTISATFEFIVLTGWAPSADQPKPLRPGSATMRLADALKTQEQPLDDPAKPDGV
ncbi:MAG: methyltransferase domain-containing protein [Paracoccaceae bacterium]